MGTIIPHKEMEEALRRGYQYTRLVCDKTLTDCHVQVRTGFNPETGTETWEYLETAKDLKGATTNGR